VKIYGCYTNIIITHRLHNFSNYGKLPDGKMWNINVEEMCVTAGNMWNEKCGMLRLQQNE